MAGHVYAVIKLSKAEQDLLLLAKANVISCKRALKEATDKEYELCKTIKLDKAKEFTKLPRFQDVQDAAFWSDITENCEYYIQRSNTDEPDKS